MQPGRRDPRQPDTVGHLQRHLVGAVLLHRTDQVSRQVADGVGPARVAAARLQAALRDQETGLRGYLIAADRQFLAPYYDGQRTEQAA
ncbi:CHASE3 domain-containing protein, partial [Mycobacterium avium]